MLDTNLAPPPQATEEVNHNNWRQWFGATYRYIGKIAVCITNLEKLGPIGEVKLWSTDTAPDRYLLCQGQAISRTTYADLFDVIGTTYGTGDGSTTFNLPNLQGRVPVGQDTGDSDFDSMGETGGAKTHTLTTDEMPSHNHADGSLSAAGVGNHTHGINHGHSASAGSSDVIVQQGVFTGASGSGFRTELTGLNVTSSGANINNHSHSITVNGHSGSSGSNGAHSHDVTGSTANTGGGDPHNNLQPYVVLNYIILAE